VINMPRFDGTGPMGRGSRTGMGLGYCGIGCGRLRGFGGSRFRSAKNELGALEEEEAFLKEELEILQEEKKALQAQK
jgi:hypothetical protein